MVLCPTAVAPNYIYFSRKMVVSFGHSWVRLRSCFPFGLFLLSSLCFNKTSLSLVHVCTVSAQVNEPATHTYCCFAPDVFNALECNGSVCLVHCTDGLHPATLLISTSRTASHSLCDPGACPGNLHDERCAAFDFSENIVLSLACNDPI